jgi:proteasome beta subunit
VGYGGGGYGGAGSGGRRAAADFMAARSSSFTDFLSSYDPGLLPGSRGLGPVPGDVIKTLPHATTIVAAEFKGGVVLAGDRRATMGNVIAQRDVEKVYRSDEFSGMGFAGTGSLGFEFARLFQVELEHYEKLEGRQLSLEGKANRLANMVRSNLSSAMQGLVVIPLFAGYDEDGGTGRIFSYDVVGGPYEEHRYHSIGSGSLYAKSSLKKLYRDGMSAEDTVLAVTHALYDAADDDSATGGPDLARRLFPIIATITADGFQRLPDAESERYAQQVVDERMSAPDGPSAPLRTA